MTLEYEFVPNIIIGAGPAGLQLGYFFEKYKIPYVILEQSNICGSFFDKFPHTRKLISINKVHTGSEDPEFNLRHDWNSLLNDEGFLFKDYSEEFYPCADSLVKYLNDYKDKFKIKVRFNTCVERVSKRVSKDHLKYQIECDNNKNYECQALIIATGLSKANMPTFAEMPKNIKHYMEYEKGHFQNKDILKTYNNKKVAIVGGGNASFELANALTSHCSHIHIINAGKDLAMTSHYAGDVRSVYLPFMDSFFLKSLNCYTKDTHKDDDDDIFIRENQDKTYSIYDKSGDFRYGSNSLKTYNEIIYCTGWKFNDDMFDFSLNKTCNGKYPEVYGNYMSVNNNNLFFIGTLMHSLDHKKSSGGFIHGFRYLIEFFFKINYKVLLNKTEIPFTGSLECYKILKEKIVQRINQSSALYQMFGVMSDLFYFDENENKIIYVESITQSAIFSYLKQYGIKKYSEVLLRYKNEKEYDLREFDTFKPKDPIFLHVEIYSNEIEVDKDDCATCRQVSEIIFRDDLTADFSSNDLAKKIERYLYSCSLVF